MLLEGHHYPPFFTLFGGFSRDRKYLNNSILFMFINFMLAVQHVPNGADSGRHNDWDPQFPFKKIN
jgi:hypothetical protein